MDGIMDEKRETWETSEKKARPVLEKNLSLDGGRIEIEHAHRVGKYQEQGRPTQIVVKLLRFKDRQSILSAARKLRGSNIYISEDLLDIIKQRRGNLMPQLRAARESGESASLRYDKLVIKPRSQGI